MISVANILHRSGYLNDAIVATNMALDVPVKLVVSHFTMANLYAAKASFYSRSSLKLKFVIQNVYHIYPVMQLCLWNNYMLKFKKSWERINGWKFNWKQNTFAERFSYEIHIWDSHCWTALEMIFIPILSKISACTGTCTLDGKTMLIIKIIDFFLRDKTSVIKNTSSFF